MVMKMVIRHHRACRHDASRTHTGAWRVSALWWSLDSKISQKGNLSFPKEATGCRRLSVLMLNPTLSRIHSEYFFSYILIS